MDWPRFLYHDRGIRSTGDGPLQYRPLGDLMNE